MITMTKQIHIDDFLDMELPRDVLDAHAPLLKFIGELSIKYNCPMPMQFRWVVRSKDVAMINVFTCWLQVRKQLMLPCSESDTKSLPMKKYN